MQSTLLLPADQIDRTQQTPFSVVANPYVRAVQKASQEANKGQYLQDSLEKQYTLSYSNPDRRLHVAFKPALFHPMLRRR